MPSIDEVISLVAEWVPVGYPISAESTFESLKIDSLDRVEMVITAEDDYNIVIDDDEADAMTTVQDLYNIIARLTGP